MAARLGRPLSRSSAELSYFALIPEVNKEPLQYRAILLNREMFMPLLSKVVFQLGFLLRCEFCGPVFALSKRECARTLQVT